MRVSACPVRFSSLKLSVPCFSSLLEGKLGFGYPERVYVLVAQVDRAVAS